MSRPHDFATAPRLRRDIAITVSFAALSFLTACGDSAPQGGQCPEGQVLRYESPGCGAEAKPVCGLRDQDACYRAVCSCQGKTISRCDYASEPFAYFGTCPIPDGAGPDVPPSLGSDTAADVTPDLAADGVGPDMGRDQASGRVLDGGIAERPGDLATDTRAPIDLTAPIDFKAPTDIVSPTDIAAPIEVTPADVPPESGAHDAGPCPAGQVLRYESAGCGANAKPVCGSAQQDACYRAVCSCRGQTISRCDYAPEPFVSFGACPSPDGGGRD